ncbi:hypothetical protein [Halorubellus litoreus]|uniref:Halobacterial output domain-containing protein n=1 Tax=Halorubellus litoreus TaxID=755308 RepID=A0ABD5VGY7_9EURY
MSRARETVTATEADDHDAARAVLRERATDTDVDVTFPAIDALLPLDSPTAV